MVLNEEILINEQHKNAKEKVSLETSEKLMCENLQILDEDNHNEESFGK